MSHLPALKLLNASETMETKAPQKKPIAHAHFSEREARARGKCKDGRRDGQSETERRRRQRWAEKACLFKNSYKKDPPIALDFDHEIFFKTWSLCWRAQTGIGTFFFFFFLLCRSFCCGFRDVKMDTAVVLRWVLSFFFHGVVSRRGAVLAERNVWMRDAGIRRGSERETSSKWWLDKLCLVLRRSKWCRCSTVHTKRAWLFRDVHILYLR